MVSKPTTLDLADRKTLMASLPKGGVGAEIGVAEGCFSEVLLEVCKPTMLYLIDCWEYQSDPALSEDPANVSQECHEGKYARVCQYLGPKSEVRILRAYSLDAAKTFPDGYFDWCYIDAGHTQLKQDLETWWPKLKRGGWGTGHDYTMVGTSITVKRDVDLFIAKHNLKLFVTRGDTDIYEKNYPSWCIQKP